MEQCGRSLGGVQIYQLYKKDESKISSAAQDLLATGQNSASWQYIPTIFAVFIGVLWESVDTGVWILELYVWMAKDGWETTCGNGAREAVNKLGFLASGRRLRPKTNLCQPWQWSDREWYWDLCEAAA